MSQQVKNGKKPKPSTPRTPIYDDIYSSALDVPKNIRDDMESRGLSPRWINATQLQRMGGYHKAGWRVYKMPAGMQQDADLVFGNNPDGIVRRGDCVLACKPKEAVAKQKQYLEDKADRQKGYASEKAREMRQALRESGLGGQVIEGYEENDTD